MAEKKDLEQISQHLSTVESLLRKRLAKEEHRANTAESRLKVVSSEFVVLESSIKEEKRMIVHLREQRDKAMDELATIKKNQSRAAGRIVHDQGDTATRTTP